MHIERQSMGFFKNIFKSEEQKRKELQQSVDRFNAGIDEMWSAANKLAKEQGKPPKKRLRKLTVDHVLSYYHNDKFAEERIDRKLKSDIVKLLNIKKIKMTSSDIDAHLFGDFGNVKKIKKLCQELYYDQKISRTGNYRYFVLLEEKKKKKPTATEKSETVDIEKELEKYKSLLDKGLIDKEDYKNKKNQLLGGL